MLNKKELTALYTSYHFEKTYESEHCAVYTYNEGYFNNAEIVIFNKNSKECDDVYEEYKKLGFSIKKASYVSIDEAHENLFTGFFKIAHSNKRLVNEYKNYCELQKKKLGGHEYSYVNGEYYLHGNFEEDANIIDKICSFFDDNVPRLIILEAAAGFGKTCTSFEVIHRLASTFDKKVPILAELSKSRQARIFKHVLYAEIDQKFTSLSLDLVTKEIREGRIPLVIDGFDELLSKSMLSDEEVEQGNAEDAQTMLDTIADIFKNTSSAKILLTSRKSSIFTGEVFTDWVEKRLENCDVIRIEIAEPTVKSWIGKDKLAILEKKGINISSISNPVLLSMIKNMPVKEFESKFTNIDALLYEYFNSLLEREKERQSLPLKAEEQYKIMQRLAAEMVYFDISAEEPSFIKELVFEIIKPKLNEIEDRYEGFYSLEDKPSSDEIVMKLVNHALLDRISSTTNKIGFINEFIFGLFIGDAIIDKEIKDKDLSEKYLNIAATAYGVRGNTQKIALYKNIEKVLTGIEKSQKLLLELKLTGAMKSSYFDMYIDDLRFKNFDFSNNNKFNNCTFNSCIFEKCKVDICNINNCSFINCKFYDININKNNDEDINIVFYNSFGAETFYQYINKNSAPADVVNYEKIVLEQYWKPGYDTAELRRTYRTLFKGTERSEQQKIADAINTLKQKRYIIEKSHCLEFNFEFISEIKNILGRS